MDMTDLQRRWWFANHPEYSWTRTRSGLLGRRSGQSEKSNTATANERLTREIFIQKQMADGWNRTEAEKHWKLFDDHSKRAEGVAWAVDMASLIGAARALAAKTALSLAARRGTADGGKLLARRTPKPGTIQVVKKTGSQVEKQIEAELRSGGLDPQDYRLVRFKDKYVAQRDSTFDPYQANSNRKINFELMKQENCPLDPTGKYVILHHSGQRNGGPMIEVTTAEHNKIGRRFDPSEINRPEAQRFREQYWKERAKAFSKP
jgi:hypothetical protein